MAFNIPDGSKVFIGTAFGSAINITAVTNAATAVATAAAHGLSAGDIIIFASGWQRCNARVFRVANPTTNNFEIEGLNTSDLNVFPAGSGVGSVQKVTTWVQVAQILGLSTSGGDQQFTTVSPLESDFEIQIPTITSAQSIALDIGDDDSLAGYQALKTASEARAIRPLRLLNKNGSSVYYNGFVSLNETPTKNKGQVDTVKASFALQAKPTRYAS